MRSPVEESPPTSAAAPSATPGAGPRLPPWMPVAIVVLGWLALYPVTRHYGNPDGPSYVAVAELWLAGAWSQAVNAYWGPLLSWLASPLIAAGVPGLDALRMVLLGGAALTIPAVRSLSRLAGASEDATTAVLCAAAPFLVYNALFGLYPDILLAHSRPWRSWRRPTPCRWSRSS